MDDCKANAALDILIGKWKPVILYQLGNGGTLRFSELQRAIPDITKKMLTSQLRELEYHDIVHREIYMQIPPKVEYSITEYGETLFPIIELMHNWGQKHVHHLEQKYRDEADQAAAANSRNGA
ncbi:helix-turn-helix transcriptional regulator [Paenibacillus rhizovicinus]|uniref:Helix-turn-helix transcriptional regulator n=1 Tax=Paenibacillus rhizovicinus TaxID=2704463 RepID=A0A6C0P2Z7_9BACL|nr:helix-turn-helix domain-containing protein [Paenibacillus rhizovicinus]QHW32847.1 helix-turn-helix transcriptional regulator [Paenibacillus rhizovicinus]